jgi:hypothetical protein
VIGDLRARGRSGRCGLAVLAAVALAAGAALGREARPAPGQAAGQEPVQGRAVVVQVPGDASWTDTGFEVAAGDLIAFEAEGAITLQKGNPEAECGPEGYDLQTLQQPLSGRNLGALIGKVVIGVTLLVDEETKEERREESAVVFFVGSKGSVEMPARGRLFLGINETVIGDNAGAFRVIVTAPPPKPPVPGP